MTTEEKKKSNELLSKLHDKYYGKKESTVQKVNEKLAKKGIPIQFTASKKEDKSPSPKEGIVMHAGATRNDLMMTVKARGVKNYRILNKRELTDVLKNIGDQKHINIVVEGAVRRWKSGWSKKKQKTQK